jgi:hypothetical protein
MNSKMNPFIFLIYSLVLVALGAGAHWTLVPDSKANKYIVQNLLCNNEHSSLIVVGAVLATLMLFVLIYAIITGVIKLF